MFYEKKIMFKYNDIGYDMLKMMEYFESLEAQEREGKISFEELHKIKKGVLKEMREKYEIQ